MYAQTIAYGLLSARISDPTRRTTDDFAAHMITNPFLRDMMDTFIHVSGRRRSSETASLDFDELGVGEVVELLDNANIDAVLRDFGDKNPLEDPVIHFSLDGTLPEAKPHIIMKKRKKKKYNVEHELDNARMDMMQ